MNFALRIPDYYKSDIELLKGDVSINQFSVNGTNVEPRENDRL